MAVAWPAASVYSIWKMDVTELPYDIEPGTSRFDLI
jgi:hypothetical protein